MNSDSFTGRSHLGAARGHVELPEIGLPYQVALIQQRVQRCYQIHTALRRLHDGATQASSVMEAEREHATNSVSRAEKATEILSAIAAAVETILQMNGQIGVSTEEQTRVGKELNAIVATMSGTTDSNARETEKTAATSRDVEQAAGRQDNLLSGFAV